MSKSNVPPWSAYKFIIWLNKKTTALHKKIKPVPMRIMETMGGHCSAQVVYSGIKLGIFDALVVKAKGIDELSHELNLNQAALKRLMRAITAMGMVVKKDEGIYSLSKTGKALSKNGQIKYQAIMMGSVWYEGFSRLHKSVASGKKELNEKFNGEFFEYIKTDTEMANNFNSSMDDLTQACIPAILAEYDFSGSNHIVDVGGGNGLFLSAILRKHTEINGTLFDMHAVLENSNNKVQEAITEERCKLVSGDFFELVPEGGDLYILKFILHDWSDEKAMEILRNCRKAMKKGTKLVLIEFLIEEDDTNMMRIYLDLLMMTMFDGMERDIMHFKKLLHDTGFQFQKVMKTRSFANIIEAEAI